MQDLNGKQLTVFDAAAVLNCSRDSVARAIKTGKLKAWRLNTGCGRSNTPWRIAGEDLLRFMEENSNRN